MIIAEFLIGAVHDHTRTVTTSLGSGLKGLHVGHLVHKLVVRVTCLLSQSKVIFCNTLILVTLPIMQVSTLAMKCLLAHSATHHRKKGLTNIL